MNRGLLPGHRFSFSYLISLRYKILISNHLIRQPAIIYFFHQCVNNETYSYNPVTLINNKTWNLQGDIELN